MFLDQTDEILTRLKWVLIYETMPKTYDKQFVFKCKINTKDTEKLKSRFLKDVLYAWSCVNFKEVSDIGRDILIWNNTNIKRNNKPFCDWVEKGIIFIEHIYIRLQE